MQDGPAQIPRRTFLTAGALAVLAACSSGGDDNAARGTSVSSTTGAAATTAPATTAPATTTPAAGTQGPARFVDHGLEAHRRVALTFHTNGDLTLASQLLDVLAQHDTVITAFVVGNWLDANPAWGRKLVDAGHEVANHTYTHPSFLSLSRDAMLDEIVRCRDALARDAGTPGKFFRPSGTDDGTVAPPDVVLDVAAAAGYPTVLGFDVDPFDYDDPGADVVTQRTLAAVQPGSIVSLHFGHA
ncbi:MAG TPA: polysaccharide deacetylase family protein, partial [Acidimicrobiia bacterium]|nr:polysaccharide deacetylase family protein [Acidimicrobiia bacterium]